MIFCEEYDIDGWRSVPCADHAAVCCRQFGPVCEDVFMQKFTFANGKANIHVQKMLNAVMYDSTLTFVHTAENECACTLVEINHGTLYHSQSYQLEYFHDSGVCFLSHKNPAMFPRTPVRVSRCATGFDGTEKIFFVSRTVGCQVHHYRFDCRVMHSVCYQTLQFSVPSSVHKVFIDFRERKKNKVLPYRAPMLINACYTPELSGKLSLGSEMQAFGVKRGACGVRYTFQSPDGNINIYGSGCVRKVTCKAFPTLRSVLTSLQRVCMITDLVHRGPVHMHMLVLDGRTGCQMDISTRGYVWGYVCKVFDRTGFTFVDVIDELNVHVTIKWVGVTRLFRMLRRSGGPAHTVLDATDLTMTVTRYGTILYRISMQKHAERTEYTENLQTQLVQMVHSMHSMLSVSQREV